MINGDQVVDADEVAGFCRSLNAQAAIDGVAVDVFRSDNRDGTFDVSWRVRAPEPHVLLAQALAALAALQRQTTNAVDRQVLQDQVDQLGRLLGMAPATLDQGAANDLNDVSDGLARGYQDTAAADPHSPAASGVVAAMQRIGNALGTAAHDAQGGIAEPAAPAAPIPGLLRPNGEALFATCIIRPERVADANRAAGRVVANAARYQDVSRMLGGTVPWFLIGIIHSLEANFSFTTHLHNGDPLTARTQNVPSGRPATGTPPFRWEDSACDALRLKKLDQAPAWPLAVLLDRLERYNGTGYVSARINSPYLWSFSQHWTVGKYVRDHVFDPQATSGQCGGAVILKALVGRGAVALPGPGAASTALDGDAALGHRLPVAPTGADLVPSARAELDFPGILRQGTADAAGTKRVQEWCVFAGSPTKIDGGFGDGTATAVATFQAKDGIDPADGVLDQRTWSALIRPMLRALAPLATVPASLGEAVVAVARQHAAQGPCELGGDNRGSWVRLYMDGVDGVTQEWCAGFSCFVVAQAAQALGVPPPFARQVAVGALIADARASGRLVPASSVLTPTARLARLQPGCLFAIKQPNLSHTGIVVEVRGDGLTTVEGNTSGKAAVDGRGFQVIVAARNYDNKDFILLA